jgi:prepilin signal peptidase PulO-like enzyme (type II secretory pathway)
VNVILAIPLELRLILLFLIGAALGSLVNLVVDRLREETPRYSPWNKLFDGEPTRDAATPAARHKRRGRKPAGAPRKPGRFALLPIVGWLELAATAPADRPRRFWVRPIMVELLLASGLTLLYWWEVGCGGLVPETFGGLRLRLPADTLAVVHQQFALHALFLTFMAAASLIDLDEWVIPDSIAITGTLVALLLAVVAPLSSLYAVVIGPKAGLELAHLDLFMPGNPVHELGPRQAWGLLLGLGCIWMWCFGQLPRVWTLRWGWGTAVRLFARRLWRDRVAALRVVLIGMIVSLVCCLVWSYGSSLRWTSLLSALVGLAVGSGIVWIIRIVCSAILQREAMGFGDVTLMAMIGAFLGWQPTLVAFFLSPFFGLIPPVVALVMRAGTPRAVPFGPFLCLGAATVLLSWAKVWPWLAERLEVFVGFGAGFVFAFLGGALVVLVALMFGVQVIKRAFA